MCILKSNLALLLLCYREEWLKMVLSLALIICPPILIVMSHPNAMTIFQKCQSPSPPFTIGLFGIPISNGDDYPHNANEAYFPHSKHLQSVA